MEMFFMSFHNFCMKAKIIRRYKAERLDTRFEIFDQWHEIKSCAKRRSQRNLNSQYIFSEIRKMYLEYNSL